MYTNMWLSYVVRRYLVQTELVKCVMSVGAAGYITQLSLLTALSLVMKLHKNIKIRPIIRQQLYELT